MSPRRWQQQHPSPLSKGHVLKGHCDLPHLSDVANDKTIAFHLCPSYGSKASVLAIADQIVTAGLAPLQRTSFLGAFHRSFNTVRRLSEVT